MRRNAFLLTTILARHREPQGVLFDLPHVVGEAAALIEGRDLADRINIESGDFFERVPGGGDAYLLSHIIHDWSEDQCLTILGNCRKAMNARGRVVIANQDLPSPIDGPHRNLTMDIQMMALLSGRERSESDWSELFRRSGLKLIGSVQTDVAFTVVDGISG